MVARQELDHVGARKGFALAQGLAIAAAAMLLVFGPFMLICVTCIGLLFFFETTFGICVGRRPDSLVSTEKAQRRPGGAMAARMGARGE